ncbi:MAG: hypothetical protein F9K29_13115 [Hyphomicrobiaceae bacterium]|nr:MAG: hypothetical protein F9K29_13115 [Hyphomicrobiaceae bacterium]
MRLCVAAALSIPVLAAFGGTSHAQEGFAFPSCISSTLANSGAQLARFIPPEAKGAPVSKLRGVVARTVTWKPGQTIKVCFRSGSEKAQERVARYAREWMQYANVVFDFGEGSTLRKCQGDGHEDIKIDFVDGKGWWSFFGTVSRQRDPSMNLQFFGVDTPRFANGQPAPESELRKTILHEFGHALGMLHEHQSPRANCDAEIDWEAAYAVGAKIGWPKEQVDRNFRQFLQNDEFNATEVDRRSIMHYSLPPQIFKGGTRSPCWVPENLDLSEKDRAFIRRIYPRPDPLVVASGPDQPVTRGVRRNTGGEDKDGLVKQYEDLLRQSGVDADKVRQLSKEFRAALAAK